MDILHFGTNGIEDDVLSKKELAASRILDALGISHVVYEESEAERLLQIAAQSYLDRIHDNGEKIVKCKIISSEETAIVPWEDFQIYCGWNDVNEYEWIQKEDPDNYYSMQVADYILGFQRIKIFHPRRLKQMRHCSRLLCGQQHILAERLILMDPQG